MREKVQILKWWQMWTNESLPGNLEILLNSQVKENQQKRAGGEVAETVLSNRTSVMMKMFHFCTVQYGSHQSCVPIEHLKCDWYERETEFYILFHFN